MLLILTHNAVHNINEEASHSWKQINLSVDGSETAPKRPLKIYLTKLAVSL